VPDFPALSILIKQFQNNKISEAAHAEFQPITAIVVQPLSKMVMVVYNSRKQTLWTYYSNAKQIWKSSVHYIFLDMLILNNRRYSL
jgi:hypothetical protein